MRVILFYAFVLMVHLVFQPVIASNHEDVRRILRANSDTNKVKALSDLCWEFRHRSSDSAIIFGEQALQIARELNFRKGIAQACNDIAIIYIDRAQYLRATKLLNESLKLREELNDKSGIASIYNKLGIIDQKQGRLKEALEHQILALKIYEQLGQDKWIGYSLNNIAIIHQNLGDLDNSLSYHQKALEYRKRLKDQLGEATSYANMANLYSKLKDTISAINYYEQALDLSRNLKNEELISGNLSNMGNIYLAKRDYQKAMKLYNESLEIRERLGDSKGISSTLSRIGMVYTETKQYRDASIALNRSLSIANSIETIDEKLSAILGLAKLKTLTNQLDSSFVFMKLYIEAKDSVYDSRIKQQILDVQTQYETDKLEQDLALIKSEKDNTEIKLRERKTQILLLVFVFISIIGAGIFLFYRHQQRQKAAANAQRLLEQEIRMNAVFEAEETERRRIAKELHDGVGQTISAIKMNYQSILANSSKSNGSSDLKKIELMLENVGKEVRNISHQMIPKELEQFGLIPAIEGMLNLNFELSEMHYHFEHSGFETRINTQIELVLFRVLQELVSNVIKHAKATEINVQLLKHRTHLVLNVSDNGIGFDTGEKEKSGIGLLNIASRIDGVKGHVRYESEINSGTTVIIRIPIS
jgi:two-component system, NarL family, sensor kinase